MAFYNSRCGLFRLLETFNRASAALLQKHMYLLAFIRVFINILMTFVHIFVKSASWYSVVNELICELVL